MATVTVEEIQLKGRDGSISIFDTTPGLNNAGLTRPRDPLDPEPAGGARGPDGLWDGFTGAGYLDMGLNAGDAFAFDVNAPANGIYTLTFRHANTGNRPMNVLVDGKSAGQLAFASTGAFDVWANASIDLTLGAGSYTVRLANVGDTGPNLDRVIVTREDAAPAPRPMTRIHFQDDYTAHATGYLVDNFLAYGARGGSLSYGGIHRGVGDRCRWRKGDADRLGLPDKRDTMAHAHNFGAGSGAACRWSDMLSVASDAGRFGAVLRGRGKASDVSKIQ